MIALASTPPGSVPNTRPPSPASRAAQNASATAGGEWRTSSDACKRHREVLDDPARVKLGIVAREHGGGLLARAREVRVQATSPPAASSHSARNAGRAPRAP